MLASLRTRLFERASDMGLRDQLAGLSGLAAERIGQIEAGAPWYADEFEGLCRAVAVSPGTLHRGEESAPARSLARFRAAAIERLHPLDLRLLALAAEVGQVIGALAAQQGLSTELLQHREVNPPTGQEDGKAGYELAGRARARLLPAHVGAIPDLVDHLRRWGIHVAVVHFVAFEIDAASLWSPGSTAPLILINGHNSRARHPGALRATLAHELCHLLYDSGERDLTTLVSWGSRTRRGYDEAVERRARAFAPAFLAPPAEVRTWAEPILREEPASLVEALAGHWGLSWEAAAWHARHCQLIDAAAAEGLVQQDVRPWIDYGPFAAAQWAPSQPWPEGLPEPPPLWQGLAAERLAEAVRRSDLSRGAAADLLQWR